MEVLLSEWSVKSEGALERKGKLIHNPLTIVYVEDHPVFRGAVIKDCITPFFPDVVVHEFSNGDEAHAFIVAEVNAKRTIDLVITDVNHPGLNGSELIVALLYLEDGTGIFIPSLVLTMADPKEMPELVEISDRFLNKIAEVDEIVDCIEQLLYK